MMAGDLDFGGQNHYFQGRIGSFKVFAYFAYELVLLGAPFFQSLDPKKL